MGQHTWFFKDISLMNRENEDSDYESDDFDFSDDNDAGYHDIFRTDERNADGTYIDDVILKSKDECMEWLKNHSYYHHYKTDEEMLSDLNEFWDKYPNGYIHFG